jgi:hypothetical protein
MVEISSHPISGTDVPLRGASVLEVKRSSVLEKSTNDRMYRDVLTQSLDTGTKPANVSDDQIDLDSGHGGAVQLLDHRWVLEPVDLDYDTCPSTGTSVIGLPSDHFGEPFTHRYGRDQELSKPIVERRSGKEIKYFRQIESDVSIGGQQP